jgi:hypothetical protein
MPVAILLLLVEREDLVVMQETVEQVVLVWLELLEFLNIYIQIYFPFIYSLYKINILFMFTNICTNLTYVYVLKNSFVYLEQQIMLAKKHVILSAYMEMNNPPG